MVRVIQMAAAAACVSTLGACSAVGSGGRDAPVSQGPAIVVTGTTPVQLYSHIARQVRACWFDPASPVLTKHVFRAEAPAGGPAGGSPKIEIHEQTQDRKRGLKAFTIDFQPRRDGTGIAAQNLRLPYTLGQKMVSDVGYWAQGGPTCDGPVQASGSTPRGSISGPRITR